MALINQNLRKIIKWVWRFVRKWYWGSVDFFARYNIPLTRNNLKILKLKNKHKGKRCFIIGTGPSLKAEDLERLKGEYTFASNKIYKIYDQTAWRPTYYMCVDMVVAEENAAEISSVEAGTRFSLRGYRDFIDADVYFNNNLRRKKMGTFTTNSMESLYSSGTVSYHLLQIAYYMGFNEVYLLGHDYSYPGAVSKKNDLSSLEEYNKGQLYFTEQYIKTDEKKPGTAPEEMYAGMEKAKKAYEEEGNIIFNASRKTFLDVFEMRNFDEIEGLR